MVYPPTILILCKDLEKQYFYIKTKYIMEYKKHFTKEFYAHNGLLPDISPKPCLLWFLASIPQSSSPQPFWHQGWVLWKTILPRTGRGGLMAQAVMRAMGSGR